MAELALDVGGRDGTSARHTATACGTSAAAASASPPPWLTPVAPVVRRSCLTTGVHHEHGITERGRQCVLGGHAAARQVKFRRLNGIRAIFTQLVQ